MSLSSLFGEQQNCFPVALGSVHKKIESLENSRNLEEVKHNEESAVLRTR